MKYLWDDEAWLFFDYDFMNAQAILVRVCYDLLPALGRTGFPGAGQAVAQNLALFEQQGGMAMSRRATQAQWDYPYGWAPIQLLAVEGLRRYAYRKEADRIACKFLTTVLRNFTQDGTIREKYDVTTESSDTPYQRRIRAKRNRIWLDERGISGTSQSTSTGVDCPAQARGNSSMTQW